MTALAGFRSALRLLLVDSTTSPVVWVDALVDEGLLSGLDVYGAVSPVLESSFTVVTTGYSQDVSSVTDLQSLLGLAWPWSDGLQFADYTIGWRWSAEDILILNREVAAGDVLRLRYRRRHRVENLDGATATTVWASEERLFLFYAGAAACELRLDQLGRTRTASQDEGERLSARAERFRINAADLLLSLRSSGDRVVWGRIGL